MSCSFSSASLPEIVTTIMNTHKASKAIVAGFNANFKFEYYVKQVAPIAVGGAGTKEIASSFLSLKSYELKVVVLLADYEKDMKNALLKKIGGAFQKVMLHADEIKCEGLIEALIINKDGKLESYRYKFNFDSYNSKMLQDICYDSDFKIDPLHKEEPEVKGIEFERGIKFKEFKGAYTNRVSDFSSPVEKEGIFFSFIKEFLRKKGGPLTPKEILLAKSSAEASFWKKKDFGLCVGTSYAFSGFVLTQILDRVDLPKLEDLLEQFIVSEPYKEAFLGSLFYHESPGDFFLHKGVIEKGCFLSNKNNTWTRLQNYLEEKFPKLFIYSPQEERLAALLEKSEFLTFEAEHTKEILETFKKPQKTNSIFTDDKIEKCVAFFKKSTGPKTSYEPLEEKISRLEEEIKKTKLELDSINIKTAKETFSYFDQLTSIHDTFACIICYTGLKKDEGHAIAVVISKVDSQFIFFDPNLGLISFDTSQDLSLYVQNYLNDESRFRLTLMFPSVK